MKSYPLLLLLLSNLLLTAQNNKLTGIVYEYNQDNKEPLEGATVNWLGQNYGVITDSMGYFEIERLEGSSIVFSYVGFKTDTVSVLKETQHIEIQLVSKSFMAAVVIEAKQSNTSYSRDISQSLKLNQGELHKAACCNLSEAFETTADVDVEVADAATGSKRIRMLGLAGKYVAISKDNVPNIRGFNVHMGMSHIPGTWIKAVSITKGIGSVTQTHEDLTGQIDVQLIQPDSNAKNDLNLYINNAGRLESNLVLHQKVNNRWTSNILIHQNSRLIENDNNKDGFLDLPVGNMINAANLWKGYYDNWRFHFQIQVLNEDKSAGNSTRYPIAMEGFKEDFYTKIGYLNPRRKSRSVGLHAYQTHFNHKGTYALNQYNTIQNSAGAKLIFMDEIRCGMDWIAGLQSYYDQFQQSLNGQNLKTEIFNHSAFAEYKHSKWDNWKFLLGARIDLHNLYGLQFTPRVQASYQANETLQFKISSGSGFRNAFLLAEQQHLFFTNRMQNFPLLPQMEKAQTTGFLAKKDLEIKNREGSIILSIYNTDFMQMNVFDQVSDQNSIQMLVVDDAHSTTLQIDYNQELSNSIEIKTAYKYTEAEVAYSIGNQQIPLTPKHRGFANLSYKTKKKWNIDWTTQLVMEQYTIYGNKVPNYLLHNCQITKELQKNKNALYIGGENLFNLRQDSPILFADDVQNARFDATQVWGPVFGRTIYLGMRYHF